MPTAIHRLTPRGGLGPLQALFDQVARLLRSGGLRDVEADDRDFDDDFAFDPVPDESGDRGRVRRFLSFAASQGIGLLDRQGDLMFSGREIAEAARGQGPRGTFEVMIDRCLDELGGSAFHPGPSRRVDPSPRVDPEMIELKAEAARLEASLASSRVANLERERAEAEATAARSTEKRSRMRRMLSASEFGKQALASRGITPDWRHIHAPLDTMKPDRVRALLAHSTTGQEVLSAAVATHPEFAR